MGSVSLPPPRPKSPPQYPDLYGKRRELAKIQLMEREISFLQEELKSVEGLPPASRCCKEVADFVNTNANADPLIPTRKKISRSRRFWKWICGMSCFGISWICCCCSNCLPKNCCSNCSPKNCCSNCSPPNGCCNCLPQNCCCYCLPQNCCKCDLCSSISCGNPCGKCQIPKCRCMPCNICCWPCWNIGKCCSKCKCSCNCCCSIPECPSCSCFTCPTIKCTCYPIRCSKFNICSCCCSSKTCCFPCYFCY